MTDPDPDPGPGADVSAGAVVGVDVGGTKILAGVVAPDGTVLATAVRPTPARDGSVQLLEAAVDEAVEEAVGAADDVGRAGAVAGVGVAAAGFVDAGRERVMFAPHLPWRGEAVRRRFADRWGVPVVLDNDANAAAWAEFRHGAAQGAGTAVVVTVGTGIGSAIVLGGGPEGAGRLLRGLNGMAGELGHQQVVPNGEPCECGGRGCWEQYASGNALVAFARARVGREATVLDDWCGGVPERLTGPMVTAAAEADDLVALQAFAAIGDWLGVGLANVTAALDPDVIVVGGGVSAAGDRLLEPARAALSRSLVGAAHRRLPPVRRAVLGPEAAIVGAAAMVRSALDVR